jgi:hypothetical protein
VALIKIIIATALDSLVALIKIIFASMSSPPSLVWFLLLDSTTGKPYSDTSASSVLRSSLAIPVIDQLRDAVLLKYPNKLSSVDAPELLVYKNKSAFVDGKEDPLEEDSFISGLGASKKEALIVVVPSSKSSSQSTSESSLTRKAPNPKRKQRWIQLNEILQGNAKKNKMNDSTAYSYVTWNQVKTVFNPANYVQPRRNIDDAQLSFLTQYLSITTKCFRDITTGNEPKRLYFIAPVLICVCILFDGDVDIVVEEDLVGNFVKAHGHFEFMLRRGNKAVCIVEAKKDDVERGMAQNLVGCEVAAEVGGLDIVYGIVTNYIQWNFLCSLDDKVEREECSLCLTPNGPESESLKEIAEKIFAMLSS